MLFRNFRNRDVKRKSTGAGVGSRNLSGYIGRNENGEIKEKELNRFAEKVVPIAIINRDSVVKLFKMLIAYVMEVYKESERTLSKVAELGTLYSYEEIKASILDLEKEEGKTVAVKMFAIYQATYNPEKNYSMLSGEITKVVKQYLLREL